jgi:hypothetical protein
MSSTARAGTLAPGHLVRALRDEHAVLEDLVLTLERQRGAVARDDIDAVNDSVFAAHRLLGAYREARTRRRSVVIVACGGGEGSIEDLGQAMGAPLTDAERLASDDLRSAARRLVRSVDRTASSCRPRCRRAMPSSGCSRGPERPRRLIRPRTAPHRTPRPSPPLPSGRVSWT